MKILIGLILMVASLSLATAGDCWAIKNKDARYYCASVYEGKDDCWRIKNKDKQNMCKALKGEKTCWRIKNKDYQNICKIRTGQ